MLSKYYKVIILIFLTSFINIYNTESIKVNASNQDCKRSYEEIKYSSGINGIVVNSLGNIYIGYIAKSSISVYDNEGKFLYSFKTQTQATHINLGVDELDYIYVASARSDTVRVYDTKGCLIDEFEDETLYEEYKKNNNRFITSDGTTYELKTSGLWDHSIVIKDEGNDSKVIDLPSTTNWKFTILVVIFTFVLIRKMRSKKRGTLDG